MARIDHNPPPPPGTDARLWWDRGVLAEATASAEGCPESALEVMAFIGGCARNRDGEPPLDRFGYIALAASVYGPGTAPWRRRAGLAWALVRPRWGERWRRYRRRRGGQDTDAQDLERRGWCRLMWGAAAVSLPVGLGLSTLGVLVYSNTGGSTAGQVAAAALVLVGGAVGAYAAEFALRAYRYARRRPRPERGWVAPMAFAMAGMWSAGVGVDSTVWRFAALCWLTAALIRWARR